MLVGTAVAYFELAFLLAAQRAFISSESLFRPAGVSAPCFRVEVFCFPPAFLLAAQRAFISWESFLRPAGVSWPLLLAGAAAAVAVPRLFAQRARAAAESFALVAGEKNRPLAVEAAGAVGVWGPPRKREERRRCRLSICWRIEIASCRSLTDMSIPVDSRSCLVWQLVISW